MGFLTMLFNEVNRFPDHIRYITIPLESEIHTDAIHITHTIFE